MKRMKQASLAFSVVLFAGCSTLTNMDHACLYNGVAADINELDSNCGRGVGGMGCLITKPLALLEVPFTLVADTVVLPVQAVRYAANKDRRYCGASQQTWLN